MIKLLRKCALALAVTSIAVSAQTFTVVPKTYTPTQLATAAAALTPTALATAIDRFDAAPVMGHPRLFKGQADYAGVVAATKAERAKSIIALTGYLQRNMANKVSTTLRNQIASPTHSVRMASWWQQERLLEQMGEAAVGWYMTKNPFFLTELQARMQLFGPSILARKCSGDVSETREYAWYFALAYDFAYAGMTSAERQQVKNIVLTCGDAGLARVSATVQRYPENGIAFNALGKFVGALLIVRGELPEANGWLRTALPVYVGAMSPWGGDDGGYANGSSYAQWDAGDSLIVWDLVERVLGVPFYRKPWVAEFSRFIAYALPPGTPAGVFGDGAELKRGEDWARFGKAIMNRSDTTLSRWYAQQQTGEDYARLHILLSPREFGAPVALPSTQPNGAYFPVIGWAAMHSSLVDPNRTSVFFKSSPFGSINHSHADQNSFVMYSKGKVLAMDSGVYDYYNSPHWRDYYKQTKAHNAITFNSGWGQSLGPTGLGDRAAGGQLTKFIQGAYWDIAAGDARAAYAGMLTRAKRTTILIRPSTLVTIDQLDSASPRKYEYNLHTPAPLAGGSAAFRASVSPAELCGTVASPDALAMSTSIGYWPQPTLAAPPHYGNKFSFVNAKNRGLFVAVLRADCLSAQPVIAFNASGATVTLGARVITVTDADVTVR